MKRYIIVICLFIPFLCIAQDKLPMGYAKQGDTLAYIKTGLNRASGIEINGKNSEWNYIFLDAPYELEKIYLNSEDGVNGWQYPDAQLVEVSPNGSEVYFKQSGDNLIEVGRYGPLLGGIDIPTLIQYDRKPVVKKGGIQLYERYQDNSQFYLEMNLDEARRYGISTLPIVSDAIRIQVKIRRNVLIDGSGTLLLPFKKYDVIRQQEDLQVTTSIEAKKGMIWEEIDMDMLNDAGEFSLGTVNYTNLYYYTPSLPYPVLKIEEVSANNYEVEYLDEDRDLGIISIDSREKRVMASPNPTFGEVTFDLVNYPKGFYRLVIFNIVNKQIHEEPFNLVGSSRFSTNLGFLSKGTYLYSIIDNDGNKLVTKRIVIITP